MRHGVGHRLGMTDERGTVLVVTIVAMLILGILAISFAALGNLEVRIGLNDVWDKQAAFVAEGGIAAVRNQIKSPPSYTAFLGHVYHCTTSSCTCIGTGCGTTHLATMSTGEFSVRIDNDPDELAGPSPAVDGNQRVVLTALGVTRGATGVVTGRARIRAWLTNDDPWDHVCASGDGALCTDPPNNQNADIRPPDPNDPNGPRTFPEIPRPNQIRCTPVAGGDPATLGSDQYPYALGTLYAAPPGTPRGPCVMYPYYLIALKTPCPTCSPATSAYDPVTCNTGNACMGMVRFDDELTIRNGSSSAGQLGVSGGTLGPGTLYVTGKVRTQSTVGTILGTIILHGGGDAGSGGSQTDFALAGPHTLTTQGPGCLPDCAYPLAILGYNPNEPIPPDQTIYLDISNAGVVINGVVYTGGTVDFGPNTITGTILGHSVNANNASTHFQYSSAYQAYVPPPGFSTPTLTLPSVIARATWLQCRSANNLTDPCD